MTAGTSAPASAVPAGDGSTGAAPTGAGSTGAAPNDAGPTGAGPAGGSPSAAAVPAQRRREVPGAQEALAVLAGRLLDRGAGPVFAALRRTMPVARLGPVTVVTLRRDVEEVLGDPVRFPVDLYGPKMTAVTGPFILGVDDGPLYRHDRAALDRAVRREDLPGLAARTADAAREQVRAGRERGRLDVVTELADPVLVRTSGEYLGAPGPDPATSLRWARSVFDELFINVGGLEPVRRRALADAAEWRPHLDALVRARKAELRTGRPVPDDVLTRLLRAQEDGGPALRDIAVRHNLLGILTGWLPTVSNAFARAVDELLRRPDQLRSAQEAARAGDTALVGAHVFEASRFAPQNVALLRRAATDTTVAAGTPHETPVAAGSVVVAATLSAMHDETAVEAPDEFRVDRQGHDPLLFGSGLHTCFGRHVVAVQLPALAEALLDGPPVCRVPGRAGRLRSTGSFPSGLQVRTG